MAEENYNDDISTLLEELSSFEMPTEHTRRAVVDDSPLKEQDVQQYFLNKTKALIEAGIGAVQDLTPAVVSSGDNKEVEALSKLMASTAQALDTLQRSALIDKKADRDEKIERIRIDGKKEVARLVQAPQQITNNNILVASREEIMKKLLQPKEQEIQKVIQND